MTAGDAAEQRVTSRRNPVVAAFRALQRKRERRGDDGVRRLLIEGVRLVEEAVDAGLPLDTVVVSPRLTAGDPASAERGAALLEVLEDGAREGLNLVHATDEVLDACSDGVTHQGVAAIGVTAAMPLEVVLEERPALVVCACGVQDPGNLGTLVRTAEAAGATGFVALAGTCDPWNPKAVRGAAGSLFRLPVADGVAPAALAEALEASGVRAAALDADGEPFDAPESEQLLSGDCAVLVGAEGAGLPDVLRERCERILAIPMTPPVESLNAAVAAGVVLVHAARVRARG